MASRSILLFSLAILVLLSLLAAQSVLAVSKRHNSLEFLKQIKGCQKGDKVKGILELKKYLARFGYLDYKKYHNQAHENDDEFDELLESAVKTYQLNFRVNSTGVLDEITLTKMAMPRCGVADIINGTNLMMYDKKTYDHHGPFPTVAQYSFFPRRQRWPLSLTHLTYAFLPGTRADAMEPVARAFQTWQARTRFSFSRVEDFTSSHIKIGFGRLEHGDGYPFDGPGKVLAHSFAPTDGRFHFDADEQWSVGAVPNAFDMQTVALHEIGHLLGLGHSQYERAIMYPSVSTGVTKGLDTDDINGIKALYGA